MTRLKKLFLSSAALAASLFAVAPPTQEDLLPFVQQQGSTVEQISSTVQCEGNVCEMVYRAATPLEQASYRAYGDIGKGLSLPSDDGSDRCGISYLWALPAEHIFSPCCDIHDTEYKFVNARPQLAVDLQFYACMVDLAGTERRLRYTALTLYKIVRVFGRFWYEGPA